MAVACRRAFVISLGMEEFHSIEGPSRKGPWRSFNPLLSLTNGKSDGRTCLWTHCNSGAELRLSSHVLNPGLMEGTRGLGSGTGQRQRTAMVDEKHWQQFKSQPAFRNYSEQAIYHPNRATSERGRGSCLIITLEQQHTWACP